jgi:flagellar protein FliS
MESMKSAVNAYQSVQVDASVLGASPHALIAKLLSKAVDSTQLAKAFMQEGNIAGKSEHIKIVVAIITDGLRSCLNMKDGGELAQNLDELYGYMAQRLLKAHIDNDVAILDEVASLLGEIKGGWDGIKDQVSTSQPE